MKIARSVFDERTGSWVSEDQFNRAKKMISDTMESGEGHPKKENNKADGLIMQLINDMTEGRLSEIQIAFEQRINELQSQHAETQAQNAKAMLAMAERIDAMQKRLNEKPAPAPAPEKKPVGFDMAVKKSDGTSMNIEVTPKGKTTI